MDNLNIAGIDEFIENEIKLKYGVQYIEQYESGFGFGIRDASYHVFPKDGSRFIAVAKYDISDGVQIIKKDNLTITENAYERGVS